MCIGPVAHSIRWSAIQTLVERSKSDVLILLDCCAGAASATFPNGDSITETISASSWDAIAPDPGRYSFTNALIEVLQHWRLRNFSAAMLHAEVLARLKHPRPITINGKLFEARSTPVHFMMTANHKAPSIELSRIVPPDQLPPSPREEFDPEVGGGRAPGTAENVMNGLTSSEPNEDTPHVMISLALEDDQRLDINAWEQWLSAFPAMAKYVKVQGVFKSHSTLLLVSMPVTIWDLLPEDHATSFVAFIRSNNLAIQRRPERPSAVSTPVRQQQPETTRQDTASFTSGVSGTTFAPTEVTGPMARFGGQSSYEGYSKDVRSNVGSMRTAFSASQSAMAGQPPSPLGSSPGSANSRPMRAVNSSTSLNSLQRYPTASSTGSEPHISMQLILNQHQSQRRTGFGDHVPEIKKFSQHIEKRLEEYYQTDPSPSDAQRALLASNLGIEPWHITAWFKHRLDGEMLSNKLGSMKLNDTTHDSGIGPRMILPADLNALLEMSLPGQILFFDLRSQTEYQRTHIHGAMHLRAPRSFLETAPLDIIERAFTDDQSRKTFSTWRDARCLVFYARGLDLPWECPSADIIFNRLRAAGWLGRSFILKGHYREFSGSYDKYIVGLNMTQEALQWVKSQEAISETRSDSANQEQYAAWLSHVETEDRARPVAVSTARTAERARTMELYEQDLEKEFRARFDGLNQKSQDPDPYDDIAASKAQMVQYLDRGLDKMRAAQASPPAVTYDPGYSKVGTEEGYFDRPYHGQEQDVADEYVEVSKADETAAGSSHSGLTSPGGTTRSTDEGVRRGRGGGLLNKVFRR